MTVSNGINTGFGIAVIAVNHTYTNVPALPLLAQPLSHPKRGTDGGKEGEGAVVRGLTVILLAL